MSSWESSLIEEYGSRRNSQLPPLRQNAIRRTSREKTLLRRNESESRYRQQSQQASKDTKKLAIFNDENAMQSVTKIGLEKLSEAEPQQNLISDELQSSPHRDNWTLPKRPPLAVLPPNRLPALEIAPSQSLKTTPDNPLTSSHRDGDNSPLPGTRSTPRKVLWPAEHVRRIHRSAYTPVQFMNTGQLQPYQTFRPQKYRSPLKNHIKSTRSQRHCCRKTNLSHILHVLDEETSSHASQRYRPNNNVQAQMFQTNTSAFLTANKSCDQMRDDNTNNCRPPPRQKQPKLIDILHRRLVSPLSSLRTGKSRSIDPQTTPNNPSFVVRSVAKLQEVPANSDPEQQGSQPEKAAPKNQRRRLRRWEICLYRIVFGVLLITLNVALLIVYLFTPKHPYLLAFLVLMKSKDLLSTVAGVIAVLWNYIYSLFRQPREVGSKWVASIVCAYAESETQIMKTVSSLIKQDLAQHRQVICVVLDGKQRDVLSHFTKVAITLRRSYITWKGERNSLDIHAGSIHEKPVILIQKSKNAGKKDTLILAHSLFNYSRNDAPIDTKLLRRDIWTHILPGLVGSEDFKNFDYVYATDADSTLHKDCVKELVNALSRNSRAIAACGLIIAQIGDSSEWSIWHLFQQFQYTFGQFVRRQAESVWGRVTCLPGPVTMVKVRPEMASAISEYAAPVTNTNIFLQQVQYQGTDRRLTWCMLAQDRHLQTILVSTAIGETIVPTTLDHYLSQRRRWAANAYFNDFMYTFGRHQHPFTRIFGIIDIVRLSFVYYRVVNTALFIHSLVRHFYLVKIIPTIVVTKSPTTWFMLMVLVKEPLLRRRLHKIICGTALNLVMSPVLSIIVFSKVVLSLGNHTWGTTGVGAKDEGTLSMMYMAPSTPKSPWTPTRLVAIIRSAIRPSLATNAEPERPAQRRSTDSEAPKRTSTVASKASLSSNNSEDPKNIPLPATPQTPTPILPTAVVTPRVSRLTTAQSAPDSTVRRRSQPPKMPTVVLTPLSKDFNPASTPVRSSILVENPNPESALRKRARYPTFIVEPS